MELGWRGRATWIAHLLKAVFQQHHTELRPLLSQLIARDAVVIDAGAHSGQYAKLFAGLAPQGLVYAVEPGAYARSILERALSWRGYANVRVVAAGLSDKPGEAVLHVPVKAHGSVRFGVSHFGALRPGQRYREETVPISTIDSLVTGERLQRLDFIKADIEGWEVKMLQGGREAISRFRPVVFIELLRDALARAGSTPEEAFAQMLPLDYRVVMLGEKRRAEVRSYEEVADYLFLPPAHHGLISGILQSA